MCLAHGLDQRLGIGKTQIDALSGQRMNHMRSITNQHSAWRDVGFCMLHAQRETDTPCASCNFAKHSLARIAQRSEEHTSELQSLMRISYAVFCLNTKNKSEYTHTNPQTQYKKEEI